MSANELSIIEDVKDDKYIKLRVKGRISATSADKLKAKLDSAYKDYKNIVVNMEDITFLSSGGIRVLLMYYKIMKGAGGSFLIENPSENVVNVLGMVALNDMLLK